MADENPPTRYELLVTASGVVGQGTAPESPEGNEESWRSE